MLKAWRIGDPDGAYPIFDGYGSTLYPGRWNKQYIAMIYASLSYSTAMLEKLVHGSGSMPPNQHFIEILIPDNVTYEVVTKDVLPSWASEDGAASKDWGARWILEKRSLLLIVPSIVAREEQNILINPAHEEFGKLTTTFARPVWWDRRLFD